MNLCSMNLSMNLKIHAWIFSFLRFLCFIMDICCILAGLGRFSETRKNHSFFKTHIFDKIGWRVENYCQNWWIWERILAGIWRAIHFWAVLGAHFWLHFGFIKKRFMHESYYLAWKVWEGFGRAFGRFGRGLWSVLGGVWRLLAALGPHIGIIFGCLNLDCFVEGLLEAPELDFEGILEAWEGSWEGFGSFFRQLML